MEEKIILSAIGIVIVVLNKYIARGLIAWEVGIMGYGEPFHPWVYRVGSLFAGIIFLAIAIVK